MGGTAFVPAHDTDELQQDHLLPEEYVLTMRRTMLDQCPVSPYPEVARIVKEDLGSTPEELFATFEHEPIASASLAQVRKPLLELNSSGSPADPVALCFSM